MNKQMLGSLRSGLGKFSLNTTTGRRLAAASAAGLFSLATFEFAKQGGHDHGHGHSDDGEVPFLIKDPVVLTENKDKILKGKSRNWTVMTLSTAAFAYALTKGYKWNLKAGSANPAILGSLYAATFFFGTALAWNTAGNNVITELVVNRDLKTVSVRTGLLASQVHLINLRDIRPIHRGALTGFSAPTDIGSSRVNYYMPDFDHLESAGYNVSHHQLLHDLITGNYENVARYHFKH